MSFDSGMHLRARWAYWAALGAGCLVGASSMFLIQHLFRRVTIDHSRTNHELSKELASLHVTIKDLQEKVRELKEDKRNKPLK